MTELLTYDYYVYYKEGFLYSYNADESLQTLDDAIDASKKEQIDWDICSQYYRIDYYKCYNGKRELCLSLKVLN